MLPTRILLYLVIILLIISYCCEAQNEIRNAVKAKANRKIKEGKRKFKKENKLFEMLKIEQEHQLIE
jgi:hypothetical protein